MNIYISNLDSSITNEDLKNLFSSYGEVKEAEVVTDVFTGVSRGFGYVEMTEDEKAEKAIATLNKSKLRELTISVEMAKPRIIQKGSYKVGDGIIREYRFKKK